MFKFEELCELVRLVGSSEVGMVEIEHAGGRLRIEGKAPAAAAPVAMVAAPAPQPASEAAVASSAAPAPTDTDSPDDAVADEDFHYVTSPIVGTFYRAPNPDADPYV